MKKIITLIILLSSLLLISCEEPVSNNNEQNETQTYKIEWVSEGKVLETDLVNEGDLPKFDGDTPTKEKTQEFTYTFKGWDKTIVAASEDTIYTAMFDKEINKYTLTFNSNGGSYIYPITKNYNHVIQKPNDPTKENFKFLGWYYDNSFTNPVTWPIVITDNVTIYASWVEQTNIKEYLTSLLDSYKLNPVDKIPDTMLPGYEGNLVASNTQYDYSNFINLSNIKFGGYGEQWNMIITNLLQTNKFYNVLTVIDSLSSTSVVAFNNYIDSNPSDTNNFNFSHGIYNVTINYSNNVLYYVLDYTGDLPVFGTQTVQIALSYNINTLEKVCRVQIGDANSYKYIVNENSYEFAIKYLGIRTAYFSLEELSDGSINGSISEYIVVDSIEVHNAADFSIKGNYLSCTGNKADSLVGFTGTICELYNIATGKLLSYEVNEVLSLIKYDTLWFNLNDVSGITNIKATDEGNGNNPNTIYINDSTEVFETTSMALLNPSRRYDIELRSQFFYYLNSDDEYESVELKIPMLFIQEEKLSELTDDVFSENAITIEILTSDSIIDYQTTIYETAIPSFNEDKEKYTVLFITEFIGSKYTH